MSSSMVWVVAVGGVAVLVYGIYEYRRVQPLLEAGTELARDATPFARESEAFSRSLLVVGDSTAVGVGATHAMDTTPARVAREIDASVENHAKSGARLADVPGQLAQARREHYDLILIQAGANDVIRFTSRADVRAHVIDALERAQGLSDRVAVLTAGDIGDAPLWPRPWGWILSWRTMQVRDIVRDAVRERDGVYVDLLTLADPFASDPQRYYARDMFHLSGEGYGVWGTYVAAALAWKWPVLIEDDPS